MKTAILILITLSISSSAIAQSDLSKFFTAPHRGLTKFVIRNPTVIETPMQQLSKEKVFLSFGLNNDRHRNVDVRLNIHNILGWFNKNDTKHYDAPRVSEYPSKAAEVNLHLRYSF